MSVGNKQWFLHSGTMFCWCIRPPWSPPYADLVAIITSLVFPVCCGYNCCSCYRALSLEQMSAGALAGTTDADLPLERRLSSEELSCFPLILCFTLVVCACAVCQLFNTNRTQTVQQWFCCIMPHPTVNFTSKTSPFKGWNWMNKLSFSPSRILY